MSFSLISTAYAASAGPAGATGGESFQMILLLVGFVVIFYFLLWRPQAKKSKEHKELVNHLAKGDEVVTSGGILGKITKVNDNYISIAIAEGVEVTVQKGSIGNSLPKGTIKSL